jgi:hypothetical protein
VTSKKSNSSPKIVAPLLTLLLAGCALEFGDDPVRPDALDDPPADVDTATDPDVPADVPVDTTDTVSDPMDTTGDPDVDGIEPDTPGDPFDAEDVTVEDLLEEDPIEDEQDEDVVVNPYAPLDLVHDDLEAFLTTYFVSGICTGPAEMTVPDAGRRGDWETLLGDIMDDDPDWGVVWFRASDGPDPGQLDIPTFVVRDPVYGDFVVVTDPDDCAGIYVFDLDASEDLVVQAPYPVQDPETTSLAFRIFLDAGARTLMIAGASRCMDTDTIICSGQTAACAGTLEEARVSDAGFNPQLVFQTVHAFVLDAEPASSSLQVQDQSDASGADIIVSDGTDLDGTGSPPGLSVRMRNALQARTDLGPYSSSIVSCNDPGDESEYDSPCATANVQGRLSNGSANPCGQPADASAERFVVLELSAFVLTTTSLHDDIVEAAVIVF